MEKHENYIVIKAMPCFRQDSVDYKRKQIIGRSEFKFNY